MAPPTRHPPSTPTPKIPARRTPRTGPTNQQTPRECSGANSVACSYDYGWNAARVAFANAVNAESDDGASSPTASAIAAPWWLDVETGNKWETLQYGRSSATGAYDEASIEGMIASFENIGVASVGVYSTSQQWKRHHRPYRVNVPFGAGVDPGLRFAGDRGGGLIWRHSPAGACDDPVRVTRLRRRLRLRPLEHATHDLGLGGRLGDLTNQIVSTNSVGTVTYVQTGAAQRCSSAPVDSSPRVARSRPETYVATGTTSDPNDDTGTFALTLDVGKLIQSVSTTVSVKVSGSPPTTTNSPSRQRRRGDLRPDERYSLIGREHERSRHDERALTAGSYVAKARRVTRW